jgi:hypothetical protein
MSLPVSPAGLDLFQLLPAVYRVRDMQLAQSLPLLTAEELATLTQLQLLSQPGMPALAPEEQALLDELTAKASRGPLQSLLSVIQEQISIVANDLDQLYDDQFIETCTPWVIPYIGDLIGYQAVAGINPAIDNPRSEVADTIAFRRRKGTLLVMEELARDATGWGSHAVEFFRFLCDTQYMNHIRARNYYAPDLRNWKSGLYIDTGFDRTAHKVDVRRIGTSISSAPREQGRFNIQNIGIFLWSLGAWSVTESPATPSAAQPNGFRFSSLGMDIPLFHKAVPPGFEPDDTNINDPSKPFNVADRLRPRVLCEDIRRGVGASYYGPGNSLVVSLNNQPLNPYELQVCDLAGADGAWANTPVLSPFKAAIDPQLGRLALPASAHAGAVTVSYEYGFNADLGGGEYPRASGYIPLNGANRINAFLVTDPAWIVAFPDLTGSLGYTTLQGAVDFAVNLFKDNGLVAVEIGDSNVYSTGPLKIALPADVTLELRAAEGARPTLLLDGEIVVTGAVSSTVVLNGLLIAAAPSTIPASPAPIALVHAPEVQADGTYSRISHLKLTHCTLLPGWSVDTFGHPLFPGHSTLIAEPAGLEVIAARSILGSVRVSRLATFTATDTILDSTSPTGIAYSAPDTAITGPSGGALTLVGCTVVGKVRSTFFSLISDTILWAWLTPGDDPKLWPAALIADRKQSGCVRFSYLPAGSITPRRFQCVEKAPDNPQPLFFALRYGRPGYCKLLASTSDRIRRGADDGGEMGVFHYLLYPQRETDLRIRMQEYLPVGMEFGLIYQN